MPYDVLAIRRYPVKSMGGESLASVVLDQRGLAGDRWYAVADDDGRFACGKDSRRFRRRDGIFDHRAATVPEGVIVTGEDGSWRVGDPDLDAALSRALGDPVRVVEEEDVPHQDAGSVSLVGTATLEWCADRWGLDADPRRLRVNLLVDTDEPFVEEGWVGREVAVGNVRLRVIEGIERCRTIDVAQDGTGARGRWLRPLADERDMCVAVYADVTRPGTLRLGDVVTPS
ncbi:MAG: MOSC N-terminal beta barrel domain-containing protein [Nocardioides sp.]